VSSRCLMRITRGAFAHLSRILAHGFLHSRLFSRILQHLCAHQRNSCTFCLASRRTAYGGASRSMASRRRLASSRFGFRIARYRRNMFGIVSWVASASRLRPAAHRAHALARITTFSVVWRSARGARFSSASGIRQHRQAIEDKNKPAEYQ